MHVCTWGARFTIAKFLQREGFHALWHPLWLVSQRLGNNTVQLPFFQNIRATLHASAPQGNPVTHDCTAMVPIYFFGHRRGIPWHGSKLISLIRGLKPWVSCSVFRGSAYFSHARFRNFQVYLDHFTFCNPRLQEEMPADYFQLIRSSISSSPIN